MNELATSQNADLVLAQQAALMRKNIRINSTFLAPTKTGKLRLPDGTETESLDVVVLDYAYRNQFYKTTYNPNDYQPPVCQAIGKETNDYLTPSDVLSTEKQHHSCNTCPKHQWKSHANGRARACQDQILLALMLPDPAQDDHIMLVKVSPTALKLVAPYLLKMVDMYGHPLKVITTLSVDISTGWPRINLKFLSKNPLWELHTEYLRDAERNLFSGAATTEDEDTSVVITERQRED